MKWVVLLFCLLGALIYLSFEHAKTIPYKLYTQWIEGEKNNRFYRIENFNPLYFGRDQIQKTDIEKFSEDYPQLWKNFQIANLSIPLPVRHPLYQVVPIMRAKTRKNTEVLGVKLISSEKKDLVSIYILPSVLHTDYSRGQELFKLPLVRNRIRNFDKTLLWEDLFTFQILKQDKSLEGWVKDLYLLHVRAKFFPKTTKDFYFYKNKGVIELESKNKDKKLELVMGSDGRRIHSFLMESSIVEEDAKKLRAKYIKESQSNFVDSSLIRILYKEFKELNFLRQADSEGLLYLFSAWSQDESQTELLKEMIFYMERGRQTKEQLKVLYEYAFQKYGKTFTTRNIFQESDDPNLTLQRKIEIEAIEKKAYFENQELETQNAPSQLTQEEKLKIELRKAKKLKKEEKKNELIIY